MKTLLTISIFALIFTACKKDKDTEPATPSSVTTVGATYAGGKVFYLDADGQHGLVVTENDLGEYVWYAGADFAINTTSYEFGEGLNNTNEIVGAQGSGSYAAKVCSDLTLNGYSDWYLPSKEELYKVNQLNAANIQGSYWTSTESVYPGQTYAWYLQSGTGIPFVQEITGKTSTLKVRAIRNF